MLIGREREQTRIEELLLGAVEGRSGALVLRGEAGIGKTALLDHAIDRAMEGAADMRVVRATGVESEAELEFSALLELSRPLLGHLDELPEQQAGALRSALGLAPAAGGERFAVGAATLSLLAAAAESQPLLVVVDDAQWLDRSSQDALLFAARRLQADRVALLFAARDGDAQQFDAPGIETLALTGLDLEAATGLLAARHDGALTPGLAARLRDATAGNPLALLEMPSQLTPGQLSGAEPVPVGATVEAAFARRAAALSPEVRSALLVAAVSMSGELEPILAAVGRPGLLEPAEDAGLIGLAAGRLTFAHPLVRSAVYQAAAPSDVRAAHRAHAVALTAPAEAERRAWHLAAAAVGPDGEAADALAAVAAVARSRSGYAAASAALERAAQLTPQGELRLRRLFEASQDAWLAGRGERATELVSEVLRWTEGRPEHGDALRLAGSLAYFSGDTRSGSARLLEAATILGDAGRPGAVSAAADAVNAAIPTADPALLLAAAHTARELAPHDGSEADFEASVALGYALCFAGRVGEGEPLIRHGVDVFATRTGVATPLQVGRLAWAMGWLGRHADGQAHVAGTIELVRAAGAVSSLPYLLAASAWHGIHVGRWSEAYADLGEALDLSEQVGQPLAAAQALALLAWLHALRGDEDDCRARSAQALDLTRSLGLRLYELQAHVALGLLDLAAGRTEHALDPLETAAQGVDEKGFYVGGAAPQLELAEAYVRAGRGGEAAAILAAFDRTELGSVPLQAALAARCRGLAAERDAFDADFTAALEQHALADYPFAEARTQLAFGERLRRAGRRVEAREQLRAAAAAFERLGAASWLSRAQEELTASGETLKRRDPETRDELTPRELQIALQVAEGKTNKEVGAALFLSPKTVEYHLKHVFRKLEIRSRAELIRRFLTEPSTLAAAAT